MSQFDEKVLLSTAELAVLWDPVHYKKGHLFTKGELLYEWLPEKYKSKQNPGVGDSLGQVMDPDIQFRGKSHVQMQFGDGPEPVSPANLYGANWETDVEAYDPDTKSHNTYTFIKCAWFKQKLTKGENEKGAWVGVTKRPSSSRPRRNKDARGERTRTRS